jgi:hypothetical protein
VDNGAYTSSFDPDEWIELLDDLADYNYRPDFVVLPDVLNDAEGTLERHREWEAEVFDRGFSAAAVIQPGLPVKTQIALADRIGADFVFLGGAVRWKRAHGSEIVEEAHQRDLSVHVGNPSGADGFEWAYRIGADSCDTSSVTQNGYWHWVERLEEATQDSLSSNMLKKGGRQATLTDGGEPADD